MPVPFWPCDCQEASEAKLSLPSARRPICLPFPCGYLCEQRRIRLDPRATGRAACGWMAVEPELVASWRTGCDQRNCLLCGAGRRRCVDGPRGLRRGQYPTHTEAALLEKERHEPAGIFNEDAVETDRASPYCRSPEPHGDGAQLPGSDP